MRFERDQCISSDITFCRWFHPVAVGKIPQGHGTMAAREWLSTDSARYVFLHSNSVHAEYRGGMVYRVIDPLGEKRHALICTGGGDDSEMKFIA
jgi:hypothetical protein